MSMLGRIIAWFAEEVIVKTLSRSKRFQRFALRMDDTITKSKKVVEDKVVKPGQQVVQTKAEEIQKKVTAFDFKKFRDDFMKEVEKEKQKLNSKN